MKKLLYTLFSFLTLLIISCKENNQSKKPVGVKAVSKGLKESDPKSARAIKNNNETIIFPTYFWDTKSMIW